MNQHPKLLDANGTPPANTQGSLGALAPNSPGVFGQQGLHENGLHCAGAHTRAAEARPPENGLHCAGAHTRAAEARMKIW
jgi:hypothetical protein